MTRSDTPKSRRGKHKERKPKVNRETLRDLDARGRADKVRGGRAQRRLRHPNHVAGVRSPARQKGGRSER